MTRTDKVEVKVSIPDLKLILENWIKSQYPAVATKPIEVDTTSLLASLESSQANLIVVITTLAETPVSIIE